MTQEGYWSGTLWICRVVPRLQYSNMLDCVNTVEILFSMKHLFIIANRIQTTQPTSGVAVTADTNCCVNCVETSRPNNGGPIYLFLRESRSCGLAGWLALLLIKAVDVETNPVPTNTCKQVWICDICHKQIHIRKQISIRCNMIEHWVAPNDTVYKRRSCHS